MPCFWKALTSRWVLISLLLLALPARAGEVAGPLTGDEWRYTDRGWHLHLLVIDLVERTAVDLAAVPAGFFTTWDRSDHAAFAGWSALVLSLMVGQPSYDVQLEGWMHANLGRRLDRFTVWTPLGDSLIWAAVYGSALLTLGVGLLASRPGLVELCSLMIEAFLLAQAFHLVPKLLLGREGPDNGGGQGRVLGPAAGVRLFPSGTPSGHAQSLYALMGVVSAYYDNPWLTAAMQVVGFAFCATLFVDDYHYPSDLIWGAAMGWSLGNWVVHHRASKRTAPAPVAFQVLPLLDVRNGLVAVNAMVAF